MTLLSHSRKYCKSLRTGLEITTCGKRSNKDHSKVQHLLLGNLPAATLQRITHMNFFLKHPLKYSLSNHSTKYMFELLNLFKHFRLQRLNFSHSSLYGSGNWDLKTKVPEQCKVSNIKLPPYFMEWINLKDIYLNFYSRRVTRVHPMLFVYQHLIIPVQLIFMDHC